jgi:antitoxin CptB
MRRGVVGARPSGRLNLASDFNVRVFPMNDAQLRWQCRRGMRELDLLLIYYLDNNYPQASEDRKQAFQELLALPDPDLIGYLLGRQTPPDARLANVVSQIRDRPHA